MRSNEVESKWTYSYSGADCDAYAFFPGSRALLKHIEKEETHYAQEMSVEESAQDLELEKISSTTADEPLSVETSEEARSRKTSRSGSSISAGFLDPVHLNQMATISISIHEAKSPVRRLGERGVSGYTRGIRTIAGTIVFLVIEDHPLRKLAVKDPANIYSNLVGWSRDLRTKGTGSGYGEIKFDNKISTLISPMNIMLRYQTEVSAKNAGASMILEQVEFVNEGIVTSVNDMVTEVVCQFVAQDIKPFTDLNQKTSQEIIDAYESHKGGSLHEPYYRELVDEEESVEQPSQTGSVEIKIDGYEG